MFILGFIGFFAIESPDAQAKAALVGKVGAGDVGAAPIRSDLAKRFHCRWDMKMDTNFPESTGTCWDSKSSHLFLVISTDEQDRFSYIEYYFFTRLQYEGGATKKEKISNRALIRREMKGAYWLLKYFLPDWKNGAQWLKDAARNSRNFEAYDTEMIRDIGVAVRDDSPADHDDTIVLLGITKGNPSQWRRPN